MRFFLVLLTIVSLAGCGGDDDSATEPNSSSFLCTSGTRDLPISMVAPTSRFRINENFDMVDSALWFEMPGAEWWASLPRINDRAPDKFRLEAMFTFILDPDGHDTVFHAETITIFPDHVGPVRIYLPDEFFFYYWDRETPAELAIFEDVAIRYRVSWDNQGGTTHSETLDIPVALLECP